MARTSKAFIVCGLGFGDEGKGTVTDALVRRYGASAVVRYNGGPQAGHNVVTPEGVWHCFAQFGAGSFVPGCRTILGPRMLVNLSNMEVEGKVLEEKGLRDIYPRLTIDPGCAVITPMQKIVGQMREIARGKDRYGSCGQGVGETVLDREKGLGITVGDILYPRRCRKKLAELAVAKLTEAQELIASCDSEELRQAYRHLADRCDVEALTVGLRLQLEGFDPMEDASHVRFVGAALQEALKDRGTVVFEGAQGALLDRTRGTVPHVTKSDTSAKNALDLLAEAGDVRVTKLGILRAYGHRHGAGPFPTEDESLRGRFDDPLNKTNPWQGAFRIGWLDLASIRDGIAVNNGVDGLALTCLDQLSGMETIRVWTGMWVELPGWKEDLRSIRRFRHLPTNAKRYARYIESTLGAPLRIVSVGPTAEHKLFLR